MTSNNFSAKDIFPDTPDTYIMDGQELDRDLLWKKKEGDESVKNRVIGRIIEVSWEEGGMGCVENMEKTVKAEDHPQLDLLQTLIMLQDIDGVPCDSTLDRMICKDRL